MAGGCRLDCVLLATVLQLLVPPERHWRLQNGLDLVLCVVLVERVGDVHIRLVEDEKQTAAEVLVFLHEHGKQVVVDFRAALPDLVFAPLFRTCADHVFQLADVPEKQEKVGKLAVDVDVLGLLAALGYVEALVGLHTCHGFWSG